MIGTVILPLHGAELPLPPGPSRRRVPVRPPHGRGSEVCPPPQPGATPLRPRSHFGWVRLSPAPAGSDYWTLQDRRDDRRTMTLTPGPRPERSERVHHPVSPRLYPRLAASAEAAGAAEHRDELLSGLHGRVVEVGAGPGTNFSHYPPAVREIIAIEPEPYLRREGTSRSVDRSRQGGWSRRGGAPARQRLGRRGRLLARALLGDLSRDRFGRSGSDPWRRWGAPFLRACPIGGSPRRPLSGPRRPAVAVRDRRVPLQPRHSRRQSPPPGSRSFGSDALTSDPGGSRCR